MSEEQDYVMRCISCELVLWNGTDKLRAVEVAELHGKKKHGDSSIAWIVSEDNKYIGASG